MDKLDFLGLLVAILCCFFQPYSGVIRVLYAVIIILFKFWIKKNKPSWQTVYNLLTTTFNCIKDRMNKKL